MAFIVIGGHAVNYYGFVRATENTDIIIFPEKDNFQNLYKALSEINASWISSEIDRESGLEKLIPVTLNYIENTPLMMLYTDYGYLDIFKYVPSLPNAKVDNFFESAETNGVIKYASLDNLLRMKKAAGRAKDLMDIENLN